MQWLLVFITRYSIIADQNPSGMEDLLFSLAREVRAMIKTADGPEHEAASKRCAAYIKQKLVTNAPASDAILQRVPKLTLEHAEAKYLLNRIARYIQSPTKELTLNETNLEHIFPQNPNDNEWGGPTNHEVLEPYLWHIGNLTIFGKRLNRTAANKEYEVKRAHYEQKTDVLMTKQIAAEYSDWNEGTITDRATKLAPKVVEIWNFDNPSRV